MTPAQKFAITVAVLAVLGGGVYYYTAHPANVPALTATSTPMGTATTTAAGAAAATSTAKVTLQTPDYKKPIAFSASVSSDIRTQLNAELALVQGQLDKNKLNIGAWDNLGTLHKMGGDYANAALYWEYVVSVYKGTATPYYSLGDLYEDYLHDTAKAEANYLAAIKLDPHNVNAYARLYTMYHYTLKDDTKAAAILEQGLAANPGNNYLLGLQQELQK